MTFLGSVFTMGLYIPTNYLQIEGKNRHISVMFGILVVADILLDFLFIIVLPMGISGAASASVISTVIACVYGFIALQKGYTNYHFGLKLPSDIKNTIKSGSPMALGNLYDTVRLLVLNVVILRFYGTGVSVVWAAVNTLCELSLIIISGVPRAAFPMTAAFSSTRENSGIRILVRLESRIGVVLSLAFTILLVCLCIPIRIMFGLESNMLFPCLCVGISTLLSTVCSIWESYFNAVKMISLSNILACARKMLFPIIAAVLISAAGGIIWLFLPVSGAITIVFGLLITHVVHKKSLGKEHFLSRYLLLDDILEREKKVLDFSIKADMDSVCRASEQIKDFCADNNMNKKQTVRLGLAIEELLNVVISKNDGLNSIDLRAMP